MSQTWPLTLLAPVTAEGYGNNVSAGYGSAGAPQVWPLTLLDGTAHGYGNNTSSGYGAGTAVTYEWFDVEVDVSPVADGYGNNVSAGYGSANSATPATGYGESTSSGYGDGEAAELVLPEATYIAMPSSLNSPLHGSSTLSSPQHGNSTLRDADRFPVSIGVVDGGGPEDEGDGDLDGGGP